MKSLWLLFAVITYSSCSTPSKLLIHDGTDSYNRIPANESESCTNLAKSLFMEKDYDKNLTQALVDKKLLTFTEKRIQIHYPYSEWINKVKKSFNTNFRNWNNNRYPAFYIFNDEDVVNISKKYAENLEKISSNQVSIDDEATTKAFITVQDWIKSFQNYKVEMDQLIEERISLQYNIKLLKKLKLNDDEARDIQMTFKRGGISTNEIITFRKEDHNLKFTINKFQSDIKELDGSILKNGLIKDRAIRQAMLLDMLTILQREMEFTVKNAAAPSDDIVKELKTISNLIKNSEFAPSTYGIYKVHDKVLFRELIATSKLDVVYNKIKEPLLQLKNMAFDYFKNKSPTTETEKIGFFKKVYTKITSITLKQASISGGSVIVLGYGLERYFLLAESNFQKIEELPPTNTLSPDDLAHQQQLEQTQKVEDKRQDAQSSAIEVHLNELISP
ncbi:MAG: hypothetical protein Q7U04_01475 [Bacteriovorax sp.]|nr:hypothetical protein [Bacteriovorax sp.]